MSDLNDSLRELRNWLDQAQRQIDLGNVAFGGDPVDPVSTETDFLLSAYMNKGQDLSFDACYGANGYFKASDSSDHDVPPSGWDQSDGRAFRAPLVNEYDLFNNRLINDVAYPDASPTDSWDLYVDLGSSEEISYLVIDAYAEVQAVSIWTGDDNLMTRVAWFSGLDAITSTIDLMERYVFPVSLNESSFYIKITTDGWPICKVSLLGGQDAEVPDFEYYYMYLVDVTTNGAYGPWSTIDVWTEVPLVAFGKPNFIPFPGGYYWDEGYLTLDDGQTWIDVGQPPRLNNSALRHEPFWEPWSQKLVSLGGITADGNMSVESHSFVLDPNNPEWLPMSAYLDPQTQVELGGITYWAPSETNAIDPYPMYVDQSGVEPPVFYVNGFYYSQVSGDFIGPTPRGFFVRPTNTSFTQWEATRVVVRPVNQYGFDPQTSDATPWLIGVISLSPEQEEYHGLVADADEDNPFPLQDLQVSGTSLIYSDQYNYRVLSMTKSDDGWHYVVVVPRYFGYDGYFGVYVSQDLSHWEKAYWKREDSSETIEPVRSRENPAPNIYTGITNEERDLRTAPKLYKIQGVVVLEDGQRGIRVAQDLVVNGQTVKGFSQALGLGEFQVANSEGFVAELSAVGSWFEQPFGSFGEYPRPGLIIPLDPSPTQLGFGGWDGTELGQPGPVGSLQEPYFPDPLPFPWSELPRTYPPREFGSQITRPRGEETEEPPA